MANSAKRDAREAEDAERTRQALELRKAGASLEQIAEKLKFAHRSNARRAIQAAIKDIYEDKAPCLLALSNRMQASQLE